MTVDLPDPRPREDEHLPDVPQAIEHKHNYGQCLTQWCPKMGVTGKFQRCLSCGFCRFC